MDGWMFIMKEMSIFLDLFYQKLMNNGNVK